MRLLAREAELAAVELAVQEVRDGASRTLVVVGEAGIGKSALLGELRARGNYRRIAAELWPFTHAEPSTELGRAEAEWLAGRTP